MSYITIKRENTQTSYYIGSLSSYTKKYYHREDGPAFEDVYGNKEWWLNGERHRIDGPAVEFSDGEKSWYQYGKKHRLDGPAVEYKDGIKEWYYEDKYIYCNTQEEFERLIKLKALW